MVKTYVKSYNLSLCLSTMLPRKIFRKALEDVIILVVAVSWRDSFTLRCAALSLLAPLLAVVLSQRALSFVFRQISSPVLVFWKRIPWRTHFTSHSLFCQLLDGIHETHKVTHCNRWQGNCFPLPACHREASVELNGRMEHWNELWPHSSTSCRVWNSFSSPIL